MRLRLSVNSTMVPDASAEIQRMVAVLWAEEGLTFSWLVDNATPYSWQGLHAWIVVGHDPAHVGNPAAIGSVIFDRDGVPSRLIRLSVEAAQEWVVADESRRLKSHQLFTRLRLRAPIHRTARALAMAAAHEVGHFLLASKEHAPSGLMQATHRHPDRLTDADLRLDGASRRRLQARLDAAARCR
jgi:hypothetical protein